MAYAYGGARALVQLHERHLRAFVAAWREAVERSVQLPPTDDPTCASMGALLRHVLGAARGYMVWLCRNLQLEDPGIDPVPDDVEDGLEAYVAHLLACWDGPLVALDQRTCDLVHFPSSWGPPYCVDAMLEHAVMHPIRHTFQLERARAGTPA